MKLLICDPTEKDAVEQMRAAGIEVDVRDDISPADLEAVVGGYDALVVRSRTKATAAVIDQGLPRLKLIIRGGVGVDNIDVKHAEAQGVAVRNTPAASSNSVAELTVGYMFALARQIPQAAASLKAGQWEKKAFGKGCELAGKTLGLIGCGRIGLLVAQKAAALGMTVLGCDPYVSNWDPCMRGSALDEVLAQSDFISLHVPLTPETRNVLNAETLAQTKRGVYIVNCGRGGTIDEAALHDALVSGQVAGAALDVFADEKEERGRRFAALPNFIGSPHVGAGTKEATNRVGAEVAQIAIEFSKR